jgi:hypothetical protein
VRRLLDFVPLLLALALVFAYFTFSGQSLTIPVLPPLPFLPPPGGEPTAAVQPLPAATPTLRVPTRTLPAPSASNVCENTRPRYVGGIAQLHDAIAELMGDATDCEVADGQGNTQQNTTKGLAYYRTATNVAAFTNGFDHWALTADGVVHWTGEQVDPPPDAAPLR